MNLITNHPNESIQALITEVFRSYKPQTKEEAYSFVFAYAYYICRIEEDESKDIAFFAFTNSKET